MPDLDKLIDELLKRELRPNTREDLATWRKEIAAGTLSADDERYIRALHARVVGGGVPRAREAPERGSSSPSEIDGLKAALAAAKQREEALVTERDRLQGEVAALRKEIDALKART